MTKHSESDQWHVTLGSMTLPMGLLFLIPFDADWRFARSNLLSRQGFDRFFFGMYTG